MQITEGQVGMDRPLHRVRSPRGQNVVEKRFYMDLSEMKKMALCEQGAFWMGQDGEEEEVAENERPRHRVQLSYDFYIGIYPVTQKLWESVMGENPELDEPLSPIEYISWNDAIRFCNKLSHQEELEPAYIIDGEDVDMDWEADGYRLPTEAEWEYAAKANRESKYAGSDDVNEVAWYGESFESGSSHSVGQKKPNDWGLYDMSGNVFEWCWDWLEDYSARIEREEEEGQCLDPIGPTEGDTRVFRGGGWRSGADFARVSFRSGYVPDHRSLLLGFRVARNA
jgi:formylglycine-generating enzyme